MRVGGRRVQRDDAGDARHLRRHMVGQQNVAARQLAGPVGRRDLVALDEHQPAHRPAVRVNGVRAGFPPLRRDDRHVLPGKGLCHLATGVRLLVGGHVQPAQRLRLVDRVIDQAPDKTHHRCWKLVLSYELDGVLALFLRKQNRAHHGAASGVIQCRGVELHVRHSAKARHVLGAEVVVKLQPVAVLKINRRQVIHQHGEFHPLRPLGLLRAGWHPPALVGRLELDKEIVARQAEAGFPVDRCAEPGRLGLEQLEKTVAARRCLAVAKRRLRRGGDRKPAG